MLVPEEVEVDSTGAAKALRLQRQDFDVATGRPTATGEMVVLPARTILVAAGTQPNTVLAREDEHNVQVDGRYFQAIDEEGRPAKPEKISKPAAVRVLMSTRPDGRARSASSATCTPRSPATSSRRWAAPSAATRSSPGSSPGSSRPRRRPPSWWPRSTTSCGRSSTRSSA